ncbi:methylmalonyl- epimerase, mitochondrial isoform X2 [Pelobates cultripes]|uniref:Methylmalonyl- epimerase, mitochondrial isoform X2 n=1 Tax=Pelobates cultripes TaxID=61616 RepID=A0AAD1VY49_PELCU|nr:methylmalonyl- epimerase, mitochondrial isoform X2 [Pelobates cultripes]
MSPSMAALQTVTTTADPSARALSFTLAQSTDYNKQPPPLTVSILRLNKVIDKSKMAASMVRVTGLLCRVHGVIQAKRTLCTSKTLVQKIPNPLWKLGRLNHVAVAVPDLEKARSLYENVLGAKVDDIKSAMADLKKKNIRILSDEPKIGAHGKPVVFLHPKDCDGVLVELEES